MSTTAPADTPAASPSDTAPPPRRRRIAPAKILRIALTPVVLALVLLVLWLYDSSRSLDRIEQRTLNASFLLARTREHILLTIYVTTIVLAIAVPLGILLTRPGTRRLAPVVLVIANIGQAVPSIGVLILLYLLVQRFQQTGGGGALGSVSATEIAVVSFVVYSILPVLRNTMVGLQQVDRAVIEAARGVGMTKRAVLFRIELPLAVPVILAGVRTALVISVGTVALATFIGAGGLGSVIDSGITSFRNVTLVTGAVMVAVLALGVDWIAGIAEDLLRPRGLS